MCFASKNVSVDYFCAAIHYSSQKYKIINLVQQIRSLTNIIQIILFELYQRQTRKKPFMFIRTLNIALNFSKKENRLFVV
jgi:hypothetical protein